MSNSSRTPVPIAVISAWTSLFWRTLSIRALLDVEDLAAQRQHRLRVAVAALLGRAAGGVALDDEDLGQRRVLDRAVGELARQARVLQRALAARQVARLARRGARLRGLHGLADDRVPSVGFSSRNSASRVVDDRLDEALHARGCRAWSWSGPRTAGRLSLAEMTAVRPSRTSSPERLSSFSLSSPLSRA